MEFLSIREFSKAPAAALSRLARDGKAVLTNNGKPAAIMFNVSAENFEQVFNLVQQVEKNTPVPVRSLQVSEQERHEAFERLMNFPRERLPADFDYKKELMEALDERFGPVN
ncbi:MAG: hypothetical protein Pg6C_05580 [Treponemataceae bacterium]|nr:MAG: hypothetical protein Pg6C_05580 [Treponemataceae bacterium]